MEGTVPLSVSCKAAIGFTAGKVWHALHDQGPMSLRKLVLAIDEPRDLVLQAVGWLAREDKIEIEETGRGKVISLKEV
jgi:hypothetical protein